MEKFLLLSSRAEQLKTSLKPEEIQVLGELVKAYVTSSDTSSLRLQKHFCKPVIERVLSLLDIGPKEYEVVVFPHSATTTIKFL
jgi:hypothetical protein